ncbi:hypothetical protein EVG20_g10839 [Dentipellis fragilis]|uniref:Uncharacterized protein n=1 Tax=Dentipellis fragilis TaxID=205917 RepID=A0A4Y9XTA3_9AGAM|nr:hypothetical protein EVG20_g10839 [Dentipellis fragilis]
MVLVLSVPDSISASTPACHRLATTPQFRGRAEFDSPSGSTRKTEYAFCFTLVRNHLQQGPTDADVSISASTPACHSDGPRGRAGFRLPAKEIELSQGRHLYVQTISLDSPSTAVCGTHIAPKIPIHASNIPAQLRRRAQSFCTDPSARLIRKDKDEQERAFDRREKHGSTGGGVVRS